MIFLYALTAAAVVISFVLDRKKTIQALKMSLKRFKRILVPFLLMMLLVSISLYIFPEEAISATLGKCSLEGVFLAALVGCVAQMPGFIAFPLSSVLIGCGVKYMIISAFTTTLMMVGILTFPFEKAYLGTKVAFLRNAAGFATALIVSFITGLIFGEIVL